MKSKQGEVVEDLEILFTLPEVARILRCSERTIRRLIRSGRLRAVHTGRCYRFQREDVRRFVQHCLTTSSLVPSQRCFRAVGRYIPGNEELSSD